jgi:G3E family GTPase
MHQSAKVNVLMGVPNLSEEFLPDHLTFIRSFLRKRPMNVFFPLSVTVSTIVLCLLVQAALAATPESAEASGLWLLSAIMALAVLEHWFLVTPLPSAALWRWSLALRSSSPAFDVEIIAGFLGAGKTTLAQRMIAESDASLPSVILVNDFGTLGVDASLLQSASKMSGYDVIELPNGCICCSLAKDLGSQIEKIALKYAPKRLIIEPSGVADVAALLAVLAGPALQRLVSSVRILTLIDGDRFLSDYARMPDHFEAQVRAATALIINKVDLIGAGQLKTIRASLKALNVSAPQFAVSFANVSMRDLEAVSPQTAGIDAAMSHGSHDAGHDHGLEANLGLTSWSAGLEGSCDPDGLHAVLDAIACGTFGQVERVKGIARSGSGWVRFDVAGGRSSVTAFAPRGVEEMPRVMAIGRRVDEMGLRSAFASCAVASP